MSTDKHRGVALRTRLQHAGRDTRVEGGSPVNPPIVRASTILFDSVAELEDVRARRSTERLLSYGARGNPTVFALEDLISELEGGYRTRLFPTGLAAITQALITYLKPGDHVLITDAVYGPVRNFALNFFERYGIRYSFFAADGSDIAQRYLPETRLVYVESPGSLAYEIVDLPALVQGAHAHGALVAADNTWGAGGYLYQPLRHGADIVISAATKYLSGHSDVVMGAVTTREAVWQTFNLSADAHGMTVSPDDAWLVLRGARTLASRLSVHAATALELSRWLAEHEAVAYVLHPALPEDPGHALWKRDFSGSNGLLSFALKDQRPGRAEAVVDNLRLFGIGASWGGFESLVMVAELSNVRSVSDWRGRGTIIRLHAGLEALGDLIADLEQALSVVPKAY